MDPLTILAASALVILAIGFVAVTGLRRDRKTVDAIVAAQEPVVSGRDVERAAKQDQSDAQELVAAGSREAQVWTPPDVDQLAVTRRQFLNRGIFTMFMISLAAFGGASLAFLWPGKSVGFGSKFRAGKLADVLATLRDTKAPVYNPEGRFYLNPYPVEDLKKAAKVYSPPVVKGMQSGVVALYQKCVHLGCKVPWCKSSQWFECPCHGSQYSRVGEKKGGPAPRGLDRFGVSIEGGVIVVDTGALFQGPAQGTNTTGQEVEGPHCR